tara:strand:- start:5421 stop:5618 length:198 start_codon:yes stop_codon:yes gene_type:complete
MITPIAMLIHILMAMIIMVTTTLIMTVSILTVTNITIMSTTMQELKVKATIFILEKGRLTLTSRA